MSDKLQTLLAERPWLVADGATGTSLFEMGLPHGDTPDAWNLSEPEKIRRHYRSFIEAGSDIVLTNSFGGTANRLKLHGLQDQVHEINRAAAALLAVEIEAAGRPVICAGSVGPTGDLFEPIGPLSYDDGVAAFTAQIQGLKDGGADVAWIETISAEVELRAALTAAAAVGLPAVCTLSFDTNGRTMMGLTPRDLVRLADSANPVPVGFGGNCGTGASDLLVGLLSARPDVSPNHVLVAKANAGIPEYVDGAIRYNGSPELMADYAVLARDIGARIIGGCCGTTPTHVRAMRTALETRPPSGQVPDLAAIEAALGPVTGKTADLLDPEHTAPPEGPDRPRRNRRRAA